jgi:hypothetical protein
MRNLLLLLLLSAILSYHLRAWELGEGRTLSRLRQISQEVACMHLRSKLAGLFLDHISTVQHRCKIGG